MSENEKDEGEKNDGRAVWPSGKAKETTWKSDSLTTIWPSKLLSPKSEAREGAK
jgi:hypothetical protein